MTSDIKPFQALTKLNCQKCRFSTKDPKRYITHVSIHNDIKFACSHCSYVSYTKGDFQRHLVTHTGKFPYTCEYCGYGAIRNDYIVKHIKRIHGDGKIQCSVSGGENDFKNASVNLIQSQLQNNGQEILQTKTSDVIDLTNDIENGATQIAADSNGNKVSAVQGSLVEVEVMSPLQEKLCPGMPLTVVAPSAFKILSNSFAQIVDVRPVNGTYRLILKCLQQVEPELVDSTDKEIYEGKCFENNSNTGLITETPSPYTTVCSVEGNAPLNDYGFVEATSKAVLNREEVSITTSTCSQTQVATNKQIIVESVAQENPGTVSPVSEGPFISSVFSLSSGSQNILEGIRWETSPASSKGTRPLQDTSETLNTPQRQPTNLTCATSGNKSNQHYDKHRQPDELKQAFGPETSVTSVKSLPVRDSFDMQCSLLLNRGKMNMHEAHSNPKETNVFAKPQTLFLSSDKSVVMQPVTCAVQNEPKLLTKSISCVAAAKQQPEIQPMDAEKTNTIARNDNTQASRKEKSYSNQRAEMAFKPVSSQTLRLLPAKPDQLLHIPSYKQPVVVLNHPDLDTLEIISVMTTINKFKGKVVKVTLSKQMCEPKLLCN
ncbi:zinc finger protein 518B [Xenopus laevis]|uniref:Zinc finger protein 518B n=2 Tax=Xenopus laevis TaxID=8355 RepID=A0A1L8HTE4_XENLA|nr:zinc finger protein 518B [Xenopus laevis]XP_018084186.1 zinc finger protein 518B [Xenopus laevis]XP_018084190.1 zinc finger protein 518B [Xenopus laevis]XP_018084195.1 zinc finger protein 518B [Xenopus laevis]XP_041443915.1 zinc finger protein 518B [Xenopus laevis]OCT99351.1 hypothetical protein XELAEV_18005128mg [Xenopus laevis]